MFTWARYSDNGYEVSSKGDKRFSAFNAKLPDGRTIEDAYQLDIKGYRIYGNSSKLGKGKAPIGDINPNLLYIQYRNLWAEWAKEHSDLILELYLLADGKVLTDQFATTDINQAHALCDILNNLYPVMQKLKEIYEQTKAEL